MITKRWQEQKAIREIMIFLYQHGISTARAVRIYKIYGKDAIRLILENPYCLAKDIRGIGFKSALSNLKNLIGRELECSYVDKTYRGHKIKQGTRVIVSGQKRGVTDKIKREMRQRSVIEPVIGHAKNEGLLGRNWLKEKKGDQLHALFSAIGFNFRQLLGFLRGKPSLLIA